VSHSLLASIVNSPEEAVMARRRIQRYETDAIAVTFDPGLCIHSARCLQGLPGVFDVRKRAWIAPENASADETAAVIHRCPSGALTYERKDGGPAEVADPEPIVYPSPGGPLVVRGAITITDAAGGILYSGARATLCRCGASENKPFCDNSHLRIGFSG
jgi:uncharacterized Fe-S cluster protein YjdI